MLEKWILEIRGNADTYLSHTWKYQLSGNTVEFSVLRPFIKDKEAYRCAIIAIGRVLKVLSEKIEGCSSHFLIQSFPTIENPEIIASIRMVKNSYPDQKKVLPDENSENNTFEENLTYLTEFYQLKLERPDPSTMSKFGVDPNKMGTHKWHLITSKYDNPFTWLNVGYWQESVVECYYKADCESPEIIIDFCRLKKRAGKAVTSENDDMNPQVILAFN